MTAGAGPSFATIVKASGDGHRNGIGDWRHDGEVDGGAGCHRACRPQLFDNDCKDFSIMLKVMPELVPRVSELQSGSVFSRTENQVIQCRDSDTRLSE
jgi:hypothetical protein